MDAEEEIPSLIEQQSTRDYRRIPLMLICGFLGAGKSTLLKHILSERHGYRIAVIMNEFGDTADIETKTINLSSADDPMADSSEEVLELANGCLCCSTKDSGIAAIEKLMQRKGAFDYILLETTGLADPGPIATIFWQNEELASGIGQDICLDGVICLVDAVFGKKQIDEDRGQDVSGQSLRQIACADVILLNKVDLAPARELDTLEALIRTVNPIAPVFRTIRAEIDLKHIIGIEAYSSGPQVRNISRLDPHLGHEHVHGTTHFELDGISSLQVTCPILTPQRMEKLDEWIRTILWENRLPMDSEARHLEILRCKGIFTLISGEQYILQGVRNIYEIAKVEVEVMGVPERGKIVLIGKGLDDVVRESLEEILKK